MQKTKQMTLNWEDFIKRSLERPKVGQWSDMSLAPVDTYVFLDCTAKRGYTFFEGVCIGCCIKQPLKRNDPYKDQYRWFLVGMTDKDSIFNYTPCTPSWWSPLLMRPPKRPS